MKGKFYLYSFFACFFLLISCKKEIGPREILQEETDLEKSWNNTVRSVAKDVSLKLNNIAFRKMLKHEVMLNFDGDANILLSSMVSRIPKYLKYESDKNALTRSGSSGDFISKLNFDIIREAAKRFPQMQIAVQTEAEKWDPNTFIPGVVFLTSDYDEKGKPDVKGFDANQNPISVSTKSDPDVNYVVISINERTLITDDNVVRLRTSYCPVEPIVMSASYNPEQTPNLVPPEEDDCDCVGGGGDGGGGGGSGSSHPQYNGIGQDGPLPTLIGSEMGTIVPPSGGGFYRLSSVGAFNGITTYRKNFKHEKMRFIRCDNIGDIEGWPAGRPEIRMHVFEQNVLNPSENLQIFKEEFRPKRKRDIDGTWWDAEGVTMHLWDYEGTGTKASFAYYEYDPVLIPNETLAQIGGIVVDILKITGHIPATPEALYGNIRTSVQTGIRSLKKKNGMSEYIGKDDYSIFNDEDQFNHSSGGTKFKTWPDL